MIVMVTRRPLDVHLINLQAFDCGKYVHFKHRLPSALNYDVVL